MAAQAMSVGESLSLENTAVNGMTACKYFVGI